MFFQHRWAKEIIAEGGQKDFGHTVSPSLVYSFQTCSWQRQKYYSSYYFITSIGCHYFIYSYSNSDGQYEPYL